MRRFRVIALNQEIGDGIGIDEQHLLVATPRDGRFYFLRRDQTAAQFYRLRNLPGLSFAGRHAFSNHLGNNLLESFLFVNGTDLTSRMRSSGRSRVVFMRAIFPESWFSVNRTRRDESLRRDLYCIPFQTKWSAQVFTNGLCVLSCGNIEKSRSADQSSRTP